MYSNSVPALISKNVGNSLTNYKTWGGVVFNVKEYEATGDGTTDDTSSIQSTINAASAAGGGTVLFPAGTYCISSELSLPSNVTLLGVNQKAVTLKAVSGSINIIRSQGSDFVEVRNLSMDGQGSTTGSGLGGVTGILFEGCQHFVIEGVRCVNMGNMNMTNKQSDAGYAGNGIAVQSSGDYASRNTQYGWITRCYVENVAGGGINSGDGIYVGSYSTGQAREIVISDCIVSTVGRNGISVAGDGTYKPDNVAICNCTVKKTALAGVDIEIANNVLVDGCKFFNCGNDQTYYNPEGYSGFGVDFALFWAIAVTSNMQDTQITNCRFTDCYGSLHANGNKRLLIHNCISTGSHSNDYRLFQASGATETKLSKLIISGSGKDAVYSYNSTKLAIEGCEIIDVTGIGINLLGSGPQNLQIIGNLIYHCSQQGVYLNQVDNVTLIGNIIKNNSRGIHIYSGGGAALRKYVINGNQCYDDQTSKTQDYGVYYEISSGSQDEFVVVGNNFKGNLTGSTFGTLGASSQVANNVT